MELLNPACNDANFPPKTASFSGTAGSTSNWPPGPQGVMIWADQACYVTAGPGVTATTSNATPIPPFTPILFKVNSNITGSGAEWRVRAIQVDTAGTVYCVPVSKQ